MTTPPTTPRRPTAPRRRRLRRYIPPQHGAWAMLLLPWLAGVLTTGFTWPHLPLLGAWLAGYLFSYYLLQAVKTRRPGRVRAQLCLYAAPTALLAAPVLALRPQLLWYAPAYATLLAINLGYAARRNERALLNDLASVAQSCLMVFVCATTSTAPPAEALPAFLVVTGYLAGTVPYVKTMIRERGHTGYYRASVAYHLAILAAAAWWHQPIAILFALLLARATVFPKRPMAPKQVGIIEIAASLLLLLILAVT
ncbi:YwiC-like family protein [Phytohabitans sp. ZYX-F-186]|uniref:YwiC-like family protein n=2 Tax=Phytohabitans maris TaxID=3071409 RepID=A0ABU0ZPM3_9ACTN|nr:YwiC-like family protein [Phytohabitans sp. ZYX-F-186]MDQ7908304.1 YwiC-like family protein [Phytohabitans sp. ZYX-F-186]